MELSADRVQLAQEQREKKAVALASVLACAALVAMKTFVGLTSNSLGVLSEAASSGLDLIATLITYFSVRVSGKPADADHQYGHGKAENLSALFESALLLVACSWIMWEAVGRLVGKPVRVEPSVLAFSVLLLSMGIDFVRSRALARVARKYRSQALEADALHFSIDFWTTLVVLVGLGAVWASGRYQIAWLRHADPVAALVVAGTIIYLLVRLGKRSVDVLLDTAPAGLRAAVEEAARSVEGVLGVERVRTRRAGNRDFIDVTITLSRTLPFERVHGISDEVEAAVARRVPRADMVVHMEPRAGRAESLFDAIRAVAHRHNLSIHDLSAHQIGETGGKRRLVVDLHLEVDAGLSLGAAHEIATAFEEEVRREVPEVDDVNTHIEAPAATIAAGDPLDSLARALHVHFAELCREIPELRDFHELKVRRVEGHVVLSCHCVVTGNLPVTRVHDLTSEIELCIRERFPQLHRIVIHTEPPEAR